MSHDSYTERRLQEALYWGVQTSKKIRFDQGCIKGGGGGGSAGNPAFIKAEKSVITESPYSLIDPTV